MTHASGNFIDQYQRSYSMDPSVVSECGAAAVGAQQAVGIATTAKHFPGLGAATASQDTDTGPVTLNVSLSDLRDIDQRLYTGPPGPEVPVAAGGTLANICRVDVYVRNMENLAPIHKVRREYFPDPPPASTMVEISGFTHPDYLIEMNAIAVLP